MAGRKVVRAPREVAVEFEPDSFTEPETTEELLPALPMLVKEYKDAWAASNAATVRYNVARRMLQDYLKANGLERLFTL